MEERRKRISKAIMELLKEQPFFARLALHLEVEFCEKIETAATNMKQLLFAPSFLDKLDQEALKFVINHEVLHCAMGHCTKSKDYEKMRYNVACDIWINSVILESMGKLEQNVAGEPAMHLAPNGREGRMYTVDEIYKMLGEQGNPSDMGSGKGKFLDDHEEWEDIPVSESLMGKALWETLVKQVVEDLEKQGGVPPHLRELVLQQNLEAKLDWENLLYEFMELDKGRFDYTYQKPNRRFAWTGELRMSYVEQEEQKYKNVHIYIDSSESISKDELRQEFQEVAAAVAQLDGLTGSIAFFDTKVYEPVKFTSVEDLKECKPMGGGGTNFRAIFEYEKEQEEERPNGIVIVTDGFAFFPAEKEAEGVPVLWVIVGDMTRKPPWGQVAYM